MGRALLRSICVVAAAALVGACGRRSDPAGATATSAATGSAAPSTDPAGATATSAATGSAAPSTDPAAASGSAGRPPDAGEAPDGSADAAPADGSADTRAQHFETLEDLLSLVEVAPRDKQKLRRGVDADELLHKLIGPGTQAKGNQGNPELAHHDVSRAQCLAGLSGVVLQTDEQRARCGGHENMVPVYKKGDPARAKVCVDVFEYPNKACELPYVWVPPISAARLCEAAGKRLCTQEEWVLACSGDPEGGKPWKHAYGNDLDLTICNTNKSAKATKCDPDSAKSAWKTCSTNSEPAGSFPKCRSRFGVFDMHGNVAEEMTRYDPDGHVYSQLKGSAFFYVDVARKPGDKPMKENYPDHCAHDPRWHVERMDDAWHVNYHLGFRCCLPL